jgi:N-acetylmuramoyl-L-alanine amidase
MKIAIDIGHANNTGARGNGHEEHEVASKLALRIQHRLAKKGYDVDIIDFPYLSNKDDLNKTITAANTGGYDFGISLHLDSASRTVEKEEDGELVRYEVPNPVPHGAHVCYYPSSNKGKKLASCIAQYLAKLLPGRAETIVGRPDLAILKRTVPVWVLCECGFITNGGDLNIVWNSPEDVVDAIECGIDKYISLK